MPTRDRLITVSAGLVRLLLVLNLVCLVVFALTFVASWPGEDAILARLARAVGADAAASLIAIRTMMLIGIGAAAAAHVIFRGLLHLIDLLRAGDPFVAAAAGQVERIGWALLSLQLLDLAFGLVTWRLATAFGDAPDWVPSFTGWIAVLVAFVLARVFRLGTAMRDELAGVV